MNDMKIEDFIYKQALSCFVERTLIKQGGGGYTIYLPKKWIDRKALKEGAKVDVRETDTSLIISSAVQQKRATTLAVTEENRKDIATILTHLYRTGVDSITITNADVAVQQDVAHTVHILLGFEITQREKATIKIESIAEPGEQKYDTLLRRVFLIIKETHTAISEELQTGLYVRSDVIDLRRQQDKLILYCRRVLTKEQEEKNLIIQWELLTFLMHIEHAYYYLHEYSKEQEVKVTKQTVKLLDALGVYFELFHNAYFRKDIRGVHRINKLKKDYQFGACYESIAKAKGAEAVVLAHIREIFRLTQLATSPLLSEIVQASTA
jgi:phosphate uptake regulator